MERIDVLLINLPMPTNLKRAFGKGNSMPPLGLLYIGAFLKSKGLTYDVVDFSITNMPQERFAAYLQSRRPALVGISTYNECWQAQKILTRLIRQELPEAKIVAGGAFATFCYDDMFREGVVDYVVCGEGEMALYDLYNAVIVGNGASLASVAGLVYRRSDNTVARNPAVRIRDLDGLPFPDRSTLDLERYTLGYTVSTARGCPGRCIFCSSKAFWGRSIYFRSVDSIFDEVMEIYTRYHKDIIYFADDTFTLNKKRAIEFCDRIKRTGIRFLFGFESRADVIDEEFVRTLYSAGFKKIQLGLESADNDVLRRLKKNITVEQVEAAIQLAAKYNMHVSVSYIIGHAFDDRETVKKTIDFVRHVQKTYNVYAMGSVNTPFPGTEQYVNAEALGITLHSSDWNDYRLNHPIISTRQLTREDIKGFFEEVQYTNLRNFES